MYERRFDAVQKFHAPGLAPVRDATGAYHIHPSGDAAYPTRFAQAWGFYEGRAAVEDGDGWMHILPDGKPLGTRRFDWCGNFQEGLCAVRFRDARYGHINAWGESVYEVRHLYVGDYLDGLAVARYGDDGLCGHIDVKGAPAHHHRYLDLDVYHKGFARARDRSGWFHVALDGTPAYQRRFAAVEPFYNGQALCLTTGFDPVVIGPDGETLLQLFDKDVGCFH